MAPGVAENELKRAWGTAKAQVTMILNNLEKIFKLQGREAAERQKEAEDTWTWLERAQESLKKAHSDYSWLSSQRLTLTSSRMHSASSLDTSMLWTSMATAFCTKARCSRRGSASRPPRRPSGRRWRSTATSVWTTCSARPTRPGARRSSISPSSPRQS